jgi:hypothetical protein
VGIAELAAFQISGMRGIEERFQNAMGISGDGGKEPEGSGFLGFSIEGQPLLYCRDSLRAFHPLLGGLPSFQDLTRRYSGRGVRAWTAGTCNNVTSVRYHSIVKYQEGKWNPRTKGCSGYDSGTS